VLRLQLAREPEPVQAQQLAAEQLERVQVQVRELVSAVEPLELAQVRVREPAQQPELAAVLEQARKLRVSRQLVQQQHRLPTAAQEQPPYLPALPMKAPCWGVPAW
jgi:hypothetical protein